MPILQNIQKRIFWRNTLKVALVFFVIISVISLLVYSFRDIFALNWQAVYHRNFSGGKWLRFLAARGTLSFIYAMYITNKNMKSGYSAK